MPGIACVLSRVAIGRGVAAADVTALEAHAQVQPAAADPEAVLASFDAFRQVYDRHRVEV